MNTDTKKISREVLKVYIAELDRWLEESPDLDHIFKPTCLALRREIRRNKPRDTRAVISAIGSQAWTLPEICYDTRLPVAQVQLLLIELLEEGQISMRSSYVPKGESTQGGAVRGRILFTPANEPFGSSIEIAKGDWKSTLDGLVASEWE